MEGDFYRNPTDVVSFVTGLTEELHQIGLLMVKEVLENMNLMLNESGKRVQNWVVEKDVEKQLLTEAVQTSYRRGGEQASVLDSVSKQMVKIRYIN